MNIRKFFTVFVFYSQSEAEDLVVIREVYDSDNAQEIFELELEKALQVHNDMINDFATNYKF